MFAANLQDLAPEKTVLYEGQIGKMYEIFVEDANANIIVSDEVIIAGVTYTVSGKEVIDFGGTQFIDLICTKKDA